MPTLFSLLRIFFYPFKPWTVLSLYEFFPLLLLIFIFCFEWVLTCRFSLDMWINTHVWWFHIHKMIAFDYFIQQRHISGMGKKEGGGVISLQDTHVLMCSYEHRYLKYMFWIHIEKNIWNCKTGRRRILSKYHENRCIVTSLYYIKFMNYYCDWNNINALARNDASWWRIGLWPVEVILTVERKVNFHTAGTGSKIRSKTFLIWISWWHKQTQNTTGV